MIKKEYLLKKKVEMVFYISLLVMWVGTLGTLMAIHW